MREYIYVSDSKLNALSHLLPEKSLDRLRELNVSLGPIGGGISLSDVSAPSKHRVVVEIESAIQSARDVYDSRTRYLAAGDWIMEEGIRASFGIPSDSLEGSAVVFVADLGDTALTLCGSAIHVLGRHVREGAVAQAMSAPGDIGRLMWMAAGREDSQPEEAPSAQYAFSNLQGELARWAPPQPVTFLARVTHVFDPDPRFGRHRVVAGSPLFVAYA